MKLFKVQTWPDRTVLWYETDSLWKSEFACRENEDPKFVLEEIIQYNRDNRYVIGLTFQDPNEALIYRLAH